MSDNEEDLGDVPSFMKTFRAESLVGAFRTESTDPWTAACGITTKIPPLFDGSTSWFKYEELIDDWLDLTVLEAAKRGPALKNRLVGDAEMYQGHLNQESLRAEDGVKHFRNTLRHHFIKVAQSVFLWRFYQFIRTRRGNIEMVKWIGKFSLLLKRLKDSWMDMLPLFTMSQERRESQYLADVAQAHVERQTRNEEPLNPSTQATRDNWYATQVTTHERLFPFSDNLTTLMFIVASDLSEAQRETNKFPFSPGKECYCLHP